MCRRLLLLALSLPFASCAARIHLEDHPAAARFVETPLPADLPQMEIAVVRSGHNRSLEGMLVSSGSWFEVRDLYFTSTLVRHPKGDLLIDAAFGEDIEEQVIDEMPWIQRPLFSFDFLSGARAGLQRGGVDPERIRHILITHMHWDHIGGIEEFPQAEIWCAETELADARRIASEEHAFFASHFDAPTLQWRTHDFPHGPYENFASSYDFYGDGSIVLVPLFGHSEGSTGIFLNQADGTRYLFTGDATWILDGFTDLAHKFWVARWLVNEDMEAAAFPIAQVAYLMRRYPDLIVVPAHDARVLDRLPRLAPQDAEAQAE